MEEGHTTGALKNTDNVEGNQPTQTQQTHDFSKKEICECICICIWLCLHLCNTVDMAIGQ